MSVSVPTRELIAVRTKEINLSLNVGALAMLSMVIRLGPVCQALGICALCILMGFLLVGQGLNGLGLAWLMAQAATVMAYAVVFRRELGAFVHGDDAASHTTT